MTGVTDLDPSQLAAIEIAAETRQVVVSGPGSGKTEVVAALVEHLIEEEDLEPSTEILVISFSNAAVNAATGRLAGKGMDPVTVQTMDSLALEILRDVSDVDPAGLSFDARVREATRILRDDGWDRLEDVRHLVVDETQDIVGLRADFLLAVLDVVDDDAGFSLLGDLAQAIYDFQLDHRSNMTTSADLLALAASKGDVEQKALTGQYRARTRDAVGAARLREAVLTGSDELDDFEAEIVHAGTVPDIVRLAQAWNGTTAFLTATNGQAMLVAREIAEAGGAVRLRRRADQRVLARWVADALADWGPASIQRDELFERLGPLDVHHDPADLWRALRTVAGSRGNELDVGRLARRLAGARPLPPQVIHQQDDGLIVSTVHRAKGLEFDNVVLVDFVRYGKQGDRDLDAGRRERFVALTRARDRIVRVDGPRGKAFLWGERWYLAGRTKGQTFGFELGTGDLDKTAPLGEDLAATQQHIATKVRPGDALELVLDPRRSTLWVPTYTLLHAGVVVGQTNETFGAAFAARIKPAETRKKDLLPWPKLLGARVEDVVTVVGEPARDGVGRRGLWLGVTAAGMLDVRWRTLDPQWRTENGDD
ncbi:UvrD-helicase domain-containing protein [Myceligenerans pegani]|uniref:DNA 3'-5' helicase n=1 Tax=Myceligenerans pegani TaxID=2776917 RepID=A0ABR9N1P9_9MICO|nr:UvrD-helicase domain-containing protein [Myceligenerans sp. TRM 65318]MBE1877564.1 ATP-dependent helicase [Myceligenerans sp. TRM 65318]MBE3019835.1 ATP-dependent helicase [Myceligenerans sp. TRM 65318]